MPRNLRKKGIAISIDMVIIVAFVIAIAIIVTSSFSNVFRSQTTTIETTSKSCTGAVLNIISSAATASSFQVSVENRGSVTLSNFTINTKKADGSLYTNSTAASTLSLAKYSSSIITINDINTTSGCPLSELTVSAGNCPVSIKKDNSTTSIC